ncbi:unnamed protein product [Prunus armeniaca]
MPDMGHIIATCYNVFNQVKPSYMRLPLVYLSPYHSIPPVSRMWHEQSDICNVTYLYSRYQEHVDAFQQL